MTKRATIDEIDPQLMDQLRQAIEPLREHNQDPVLWAALEQYLSEARQGALFPAMPDTFALYFQQAWNMWPAPGKRRSSKTKAKQKFYVIARKIGPQAVLDAVNAFALSPDAEKDDGAYTPALDRWLGNGRWEVWLEDVAPKRIGFV